MGKTENALSLEDALSIAGWPAALATAEKQPRVVHTAQEFRESLLVGQHIDRVVVLRDGVRLLDQQHAVPPPLIHAARTQPSTTAFLDALDESLLSTLRGRVYITESDERDEREVKKADDGTPLDTLLDKRSALRRETDGTARVYIGELRRAAKYRHPIDNRFVKTVCSFDVKDWLGRQTADAMPYWDRYDEGVFVGGRFAGSPMHVDQVGWSNVGKNFCGAKLLVVWPYGEESRDMFDALNYTLFTPPLREAERAALFRACCVALVRPGDAFVFSGANAHMAISLSTELSLTAYESFVNLNTTNLEAFLDTGTHRQYRQCRAQESMLEDIKLDVAESLYDLTLDLEDCLLEDKLLQEHAPVALELLRTDSSIRKHMDAERKRENSSICMGAAERYLNGIKETDSGDERERHMAAATGGQRVEEEEDEERDRSPESKRPRTDKA